MNTSLNMRCGSTGVALIKGNTSFSLSATRGVGTLTIGWDHTDNVYEGQTITNEEAEAFFLLDLRNRAESNIPLYVNIPLSQNQFDALCSFFWDLGPGSFVSSGLAQTINSRDVEGVEDIWLQAGGSRRLRGLEYSLFSRKSPTITMGGSIGAFKKVGIDGKANFNSYVHTGPPITVGELLKDPSFPLDPSEVSERDLLGYTVKGVTNHEKIHSNLLEGDYKKNVEYMVSEGTVLHLPNSKMSIEVGRSSNLSIGENEFSGYFPKILSEMLGDPIYKSKTKSGANSYLRSQHAMPTILGWSRTLYLGEKNSDDRSLGYTDLTKDAVSALTTNSINGSGTFTVELTPVGGVYRNGIWERKGIQETLSGQVSQVNLNPTSDRREKLYYQEIFRENDLIFISFDKSDVEISQKSVANNWYDMIGMIDSVQVNTSANHVVSIVISGSSLVKVLREDNSYFNPYSINTASSVFGKTPLSNGRFLDGKFHSLESLLARSIQTSINFIFHKIASIGFVPDDIFTSWGNLTKVSIWTKTPESGKRLTDVWDSYSYKDSDKNVEGIWQIMKLFVDKSVSNLRITDSSISNPNGSIFDIIKKVCQDPFVEFFTDTYKNKFYLIARQPPFSRKAMESVLLSENIETDLESFTAKKSLSASDEKLLLEGSKQSKNKFPQMIEIEEGDVISENLSFSEESYSWYQLTDRGNYAGASISQGIYPGVYFDQMAQIFGNSRLNIISNYSSQDFWNDNIADERRDKYAKHASELLGWIIETHIHLPFTRLGTIVIQGDHRIKVGTFIFYQPTQEVFYVKSVTQQLSIGTKIDRVTQLTVERGMVKKYISGGEITSSGEEISYFNLVNVEKFKDSYYRITARETDKSKFDQKSGLSVNPEVLDFFLKKKQIDNG